MFYPTKKGLYDSQFEHDACGFGFVCNILGEPSHKIINQGLKILRNLDHRGAVGSEPNSGDGAGALMQIPHTFLKKELAKKEIQLGAPASYGVGQIFFPKKKQNYLKIKKFFEEEIKKYKLPIIAWRKVPTDNQMLGATPLRSEPIIEQVFIENKFANDLVFEQQLYYFRKVIEKKIFNSDFPDKEAFFPVSFSCKTMVYKGQLTANQLGDYFLDLKDKELKSAFLIVHSRFSTNTFPSWKLAHPFRVIAHNGEINTKKGNVNWIKARESRLHSNVFSRKQIKSIEPIALENNSDSMNFDSVLDFFIKSGKSLAEAIMIMIPEAWEEDPFMDEAKRDFYRFYASFMEPWDGPAAIAFSDGRYVGGTLDRNGLRPSRYTLYEDNTLVMASEGGVLDLPFSEIVFNKKLEPGKLLLVDLVEKRIISDEEIKKQITTNLPYKQWNKSITPLASLKSIPSSVIKEQKKIKVKAKAFGYTQEDFKTIIGPMCNGGKEPVGSMGRDIPLAVLSKKPVALFNYFYQLFAQVTNPPIDPIREKNFMSLKTYLGAQKNLFSLKEDSSASQVIECETPILTNAELTNVKALRNTFVKVETIDATYSPLIENLNYALKKVVQEIYQAVKNGAEIIIISDKKLSREKMYIPSLLILAASHQYLVEKKIRSECSLVVESGEVREVHHIALLLGYGANAVNPYLIFESISWLFVEGVLEENLTSKLAEKNYVNAVNQGLLKIISKMGISTIRSYVGAKIFEAVGISDELIATCFAGTSSRLGGIGLKEIEKDYLTHFQNAFSHSTNNLADYLPGGEYKWRSRGEKHLFNPNTVHLLQQACRTKDYSLFEKYSTLINNQNEDAFTLRGLLEFTNQKPIPLDQVEKKEEIFKRLVTGAMSFGSISWEAHTTLAKAMNRIGGKSNTGEGGEDPIRFVVTPGKDSMRSAIKQVASGRFGVTANYLVNADEIQIKIAQGAKPGEGGQLPGHKVDKIIARVRYSTPGVELISPPPHHDIYSIEDLAQLIYDLKCINPQAKVSVKLVSSAGVGTIAAGVVKGYADTVTIAGFDGGTGASPLSSIKHTGLPWELGLAETHQTLVLNKLRNRARLQTDGQIKTARDIVIATLLGAEEWGVATAALVVMGCIIMRKCHLNTCPVGIATQREELRKLFPGEVDHLVSFFTFLIEDVRKIMAGLGFKTISEMVGRTDKLKKKPNLKNPKWANINLDNLLYPSKAIKLSEQFCCVPQPLINKTNLDYKYLKEVNESLKTNKKLTIQGAIKNTNRAFGSTLSYHITKAKGEKGLPAKRISFHLTGSAGQSFAAFSCHGMHYTLVGEANDYFAKGLSGASLIVRFPEEANFDPQKNIIVGNVAFYGATAGMAYIGGIAGERFAVRNSGAEIVIEGVGAHGLEYMTGGRVIILGKIGRNFAAGMSGGIAYVYNEKSNLEKINKGLVEIEKLHNEEEILYLKKQIKNHFSSTKSKKAQWIIDNFSKEVDNFIKVIPKEYKKIIASMGKKKIKIA